MHLLLVEDDDADAAALSAAMVAAGDTLTDAGVEVDRARSLRDAVDRSLTTQYDGAVVDLALPDSWGLDTVLRFARLAPDIPIVVITGSQGPAFAEKARRAGAVGFVTKSVDVVETAKQALAAFDRPVDDELADLDRMSTPPSPRTARLYGREDLLDADPAQWTRFVERYVDLLDMALDQAAFEHEQHVGSHLRTLANELGALGGGPRDVVSIYTAAVRRKVEGQATRSEAMLKEARMTVLETMGHLAAYYRTAALGVRHDVFQDRDPADGDGSDGEPS